MDAVSSSRVAKFKFVVSFFAIIGSGGFDCCFGGGSMSMSTSAVMEWNPCIVLSYHFIADVT